MTMMTMMMMTLLGSQNQHLPHRHCHLVVITISGLLVVCFGSRTCREAALLVRLQMHQEPDEELAPEPVGPRPCGRAQAKRSGKAMRGPSGLASRWASFVLGVLGYRNRFRRGGA